MTKKITPDYEADAASTQSTDLSAISKLADALIEKQEKLEEAEAVVKGIKSEIHRLQCADIPEAMASCNVKDFTLTDGSKINLKDVTRAALPTLRAISMQKDPDKREEMEERFQQGIGFLRETGAGSLVRNVVSADLGKDSDALATKAVKALKKLGIDAHAELGVNANSLTAWVKERLEQGLPVDPDTFAVYTSQQAQVKKPRVTRRK